MRSFLFNVTKKSIVLWIVLISIQALSQTKFELVPAQSQLKWKGSMVTGGNHVGTLNLVSGSLMMDAAGLPIKGTFEIDMNTLKNSDVKPAKSAQELEDHLKSKDFFDVERFPKAYLSILKTAPVIAYPNQNQYTITGMLMIRGIANQIVFPCTITIVNGVAKVKADMEFNRTKWDITYHSASFFATVKDEIISDQIKISVDLTLAAKK